MGFILIIYITIFAIVGCTSTQNGERKINSVEQTVKEKKLFEFNTETESGVPLKDVKVRVNALGAPEIAYSDENGYVQVKIPSEGDVRINLEKEGYETQTITVNLNTEQSINRRYRLKRKRKSESDIDLYSEKIAQNSPKDSKDINNEKITQVISLNKDQSKNQSNFFGEAEDFLFEIKECRKISSDERKCTLLITNKEEERGLVIYGNYGRIGQSMLIDSSGNEALASKVTFGKKSNRAYVAKNMLFNIPTKVTIVFKGLISDDISVLLLSARSDDIYKQFNVKILPQPLNTGN